MNYSLFEMTKDALLDTLPFCNNIINLICEYSCSIFKPDKYIFNYRVQINELHGEPSKKFIILQRLNNINLIIQPVYKNKYSRILIRKIYHRNGIEYIRYNRGFISANGKLVRINNRNIIE